MLVLVLIFSGMEYLEYNIVQSKVSGLFVYVSIPDRSVLCIEKVRRVSWKMSRSSRFECIWLFSVLLGMNLLLYKCFF